MKLLMLSILALSLIGCSISESESEAVIYYQQPRNLAFKLGDLVSPKIFPNLRCTVSENLPEKKYDWMIKCSSGIKVKKWYIYDHELQVFQE